MSRDGWSKVEKQVDESAGMNLPDGPLVGVGEGLPVEILDESPDGLPVGLPVDMPIGLAGVVEVSFT